MLEEITPINFFFITLYNIIVFRNYQHDFALKSFHPSYLWFLKKNKLHQAMKNQTWIN
jgi:hypothetical protein